MRLSAIFFSPLCNVLWPHWFGCGCKLRTFEIFDGVRKTRHGLVECLLLFVIDVTSGTYSCAKYMWGWGCFATESCIVPSWADRLCTDFLFDDSIEVFCGGLLSTNSFSIFGNNHYAATLSALSYATHLVESMLRDQRKAGDCNLKKKFMAKV